MVTLDGTKTLTDIRMINGFIMCVYIICTVLCFSPHVIKLTILVSSVSIL